MKNYFSFNKKDPIFEKILKFIKTSNIKNVLDVGCGNGFLLEMIRKNFSNIKIKGIDIEKNLLKSCKNKGLNVKRGNILNIPFNDASFDLIIAKDVIEHVKDNYRAIQELIRVSRKYIFISTPAPFTEAAWGDFFHIRPYTKTTMRHIAKIFDLKIIEINSIKRKLPFRLVAKLWMQPFDDIAVYAFYEK